jgi:hypothetical protein
MLQRAQLAFFVPGNPPNNVNSHIDFLMVDH